MTTATKYLNNPHLKVVDEYFTDAPWWEGQVISKAGRFEHKIQFRADSRVQLTKLIADAATIYKGVKLAFPDAAHSEIDSLYRTAHWFTGFTEIEGDDYKDMQAGDTRQIQRMAKEVDSINYAFDQDLEDWFVGHGETYTDDVDYSPEWMPWFGLKATSTDIGDPQDMQIKVTTIANNIGTSGAALYTDTILTSRDAKGATPDFVNATFGPIIIAFSKFVDAKNGRRMVHTANKYSTTARFTMLCAPELIDSMEHVYSFDGEKILMQGPSIADQIRARNIEIVACPSYTAGLVEDAGSLEGACYFALVADFPRNFLLGMCNSMEWSEWYPTDTTPEPDWAKQMKTRVIPLTVPYSDGTNYFKAVFTGYFYFMDDE